MEALADKNNSIALQLSGGKCLASPTASTVSRSSPLSLIAECSCRTFDRGISGFSQFTRPWTEYLYGKLLANADIGVGEGYQIRKSLFLIED